MQQKKPLTQPGDLFDRYVQDVKALHDAHTIHSVQYFWLTPSVVITSDNNDVLFGCYLSCH